MTKSELDPNTPREQALAAVERAGATAPELVALWLEHENASALLEVSENGKGAARKAARRALRVLRARGVSLPRHRRVATLGGAEPATTEKAWLLAPDPAFNVLLVVARRSATSRFQTALVFLNDGYGVMRVQRAEYSQSALKKAIGQIAPASSYKPIEVSVEWARSRIASALAAQRQRGLIEPMGLSSAAELLGPAPNEPLPHPFDAEGLEVALEDAQEMSKGSGELHGLPEFRAWLPSRQAIDEMLRDVGKQLTPGQQPDTDELQQLLQAAVVAATDRYFTPEARQRLAGVMKDSALSVLARDGESLALKVAATIQCIENAGLITNPPSEVPFLRTFFDKAVAYLLAEGKGSLKIPIPNQPGPQAEPAGATEPAVAGSEPAQGVPGDDQGAE